VQVVRAPSCLVEVYTIVLVAALWLTLVPVSESAIEVELTSLLGIPVPDGEMLVLLPPGTSYGGPAGALLPCGEISVEDDAVSDAGTVIVIVTPPGCVDVSVCIEVDTTLAPGPNPEAAVPEPEAAIDVPLPPGTGYGAPDPLGTAPGAELSLGETSVEEDGLLEAMKEPLSPPSVTVTMLPDPPFPPCSVTVTTLPLPLSPCSVTVTMLPLCAACVSVMVIY
jgi:hypothetical protein